MIYSWMATQFMIALTFIGMWIWIGLPVPRHIVPLPGYVFALLMEQLHTSQSYNLPWLNLPQKLSLLAHLILIGWYYSYGVFSGMLVFHRRPHLFSVKTIMHVLQWPCPKSLHPAHNIWILNTMPSTNGSNGISLTA